MKITPALTKANGKPWNDEYDDDTIRYYEKVDEDKYFYELYVLVNGKKAAIIITDHGVSINFYTGAVITTNITPRMLIPKSKLSWNDIHKIVKILERTDGEGKSYSKKEMDEFYKEWVSQGRP